MSVKSKNEPDIWKEYFHLFKRIEIPARKTLLKEGQVARTAYFIEKGCLRLWYNNDGKDITFQFFFEGDSVSSIESFKSKQPSPFSLESIEPSVLLSIDRKNLNFIIQRSPAVKCKMEEQIFHRLLFYQKLFLSRIRNKPEQRYKELLQQYPEILQRVPQHYIASYLGITAVSLSRIRNRR